MLYDAILFFNQNLYLDEMGQETNATNYDTSRYLHLILNNNIINQHEKE